MKKGLIFATTLAMALGVGVAVGAHQNKAVEVKAASTTLYLDISGLDWWDNDGAEVRAHCWGGSAASTTWPGKMMSLVAGTTTKYSVEIDDGYTSVIFTRVKPSDHTTVWNRSSKDQGTPINLPSDYSVHNEWVLEYDGTNYDDGNYTGSWSLYTPPAVTYSVTCVLDGVAQTPVQVAEGDLPAVPDAQFGKSFSGWCSDSDCTVPAVGVTADTTVYGKFTALPTVTYTVDVSKVSDIYSEPHLYAFEDEVSNAAWPGVAYNGNTITIPNDAKFIITDGAAEGTKQTVDITQSGVANDVLRILSSVDGEGHNEVVWESAVDEPAEDGYYLVGSETNFKFKNATKMSTTGIAAENVAELMNYSAKQDEKIKVRGFFRNDADPDKWSFYDGGAKEFGDIDGDANFVFSKDQPVDIFAKWVNVKVSEDPEKWEYQLKFYVTEHAERYNISIYDVLFEGKRLASTSEEPHVARATEGVNFEYELPDMNGYYARGLYTDAACTVEYVPTKYNADATLYAKYTRLGEYMTGDATYSGSEALAWNVDGANYLSTVVNDPNNRLEGSVTIPASASKEHPVAVKALRYIGDATNIEGEEEKHTQWEGVTYTLGAEYSFVSLDKDSNLSFTKGGTFAVYINKSNEIFLNEGADAFYTKFLTDTGAVCKTDNTTDPVRLGEVWEELKGVYESLSSTEKETIEAIGFDGGDEKGDDLHKMMARYAYIVTKYGSDAFENFIFPLVHVDPHPNMVYGGLNAMDAADNTTMIIVISIATVSALAFTMLLVFKKRKQK